MKNIEIRIKDAIRQYQKYHQVISTPFLDKSEQATAKMFLKHIPHCFDGGYPHAEYCKLYIGEENPLEDIVCLIASYANKYDTIGHRDILGALMGLQIERNTVGDFFVLEDKIYLYTTDAFADFLIKHLIQIRKSHITFKRNETHISKPEQFETFTKIVSSERIDSLVSAIVACSRSKAQEMIKNNLIKINHVIIAQTDKLCNNNSIISIRGVGRFKYCGILQTTKKNNYVVEFQKYIS